ncbi:GNAT family N-acetyltransferase [Pirellulaceae bacterium SH449]
MKMDELHKAMSWEEFLTYPRKLGWKYEYYGGMMHLSPAWTAIATFFLSLETLQPLREQASATTQTNLSIRPVEPADRSALNSLFCDSFFGSIDYASCGQSDLLRYAQQSLDPFLGSTPPAFFSACRLAEVGGRVIGCCMIAHGELGPILQPIFVATGYQRRGIATNLLLASLQDVSMGAEHRLCSKCNLGNEASMSWHLRCGFIEEPCRWTAGHRANIYTQEAERQEMLGLSTATAARELADFWSKQRTRLEFE